MTSDYHSGLLTISLGKNIKKFYQYGSKLEIEVHQIRVVLYVYTYENLKLIYRQSLILIIILRLRCTVYCVVSSLNWLHQIKTEHIFRSSPVGSGRPVTGLPQSGAEKRRRHRSRVPKVD